jgi:hypothetical protein
MKAQVFSEFEFIEEDLPLEPTLRKFVGLIQQQHWPLYNEA